MKPDFTLFARVAAAVPAIRPGDIAANVQSISACISEARESGACAVLFPELSVTGCTCGDLFLSETFLDAAENAVAGIARFVHEPGRAVFCGAPVRSRGRVYDACIAIRGGAVIGIVPASRRALASGAGRWFAGAEDAEERTVRFAGFEVPFGTDLVFRCDSGASFAVCAGRLDSFFAGGAAGAEIILNPFAEASFAGSADMRRSQESALSALGHCALACAGAGAGESTAEGVFGGRASITESGEILAENADVSSGRRMVCADIDTDFIRYERRLRGWTPTPTGIPRREIPFGNPPMPQNSAPMRPLSRHPFIPDDPAAGEIRAREILSIQACALAGRLVSAKFRSAVVGLSGGLDSALALLVAVDAFRIADLPLSRLHVLTMPGFGTTKRTRGNAELLCESLGLKIETIDIAPAAAAHLRDIGHPEDARDATYENAQARERTQVLMDVANQRGGIVVGTGDMSEIALGWCTYNGDHMSMYGVNSGVPKTLVRNLAEFKAEEFAASGNAGAASALRGILDTPVSPELLPSAGGESMSQKTEDILGPYELHDFFLYHFLQRGAGREKTAYLAKAAFEGTYGGEEIERRLDTFFSRFFSQQFKRSCSPDGPQVLGVSLSPRGGWNMPSDVSGAAFTGESK